jgi:hypothetical protein
VSISTMHLIASIYQTPPTICLSAYLPHTLSSGQGITNTTKSWKID